MRAVVFTGRAAGEAAAPFCGQSYFREELRAKGNARKGAGEGVQDAKSETNRVAVKIYGGVAAYI